MCWVFVARSQRSIWLSRMGSGLTWHCFESLESGVRTKEQTTAFTLHSFSYPLPPQIRPKPQLTTPNQTKKPHSGRPLPKTRGCVEGIQHWSMGSLPLALTVLLDRAHCPDTPTEEAELSLGWRPARLSTSFFPPHSFPFRGVKRLELE